MSTLAFFFVAFYDVVPQLLSASDISNVHVAVSELLEPVPRTADIDIISVPVAVSELVEPVPHTANVRHQ